MVSTSIIRMGQKKVAPKLATCAGCLNLFDYKTLSNYRKKKFCGSDTCKNIIDKKVKHTNYKKKMKKIRLGTYRGGVPIEVRQFILNRDGYTCALCLNCDDGEFSKMQVHHIIPVSEGRDDSGSNLITLCYDCHKELHNDGWENYVKILQESIKDLETERKAG